MTQPLGSAFMCPRVAFLMPDFDSVEELAALSDIRLVKITDRGLVLQGTEEHWKRKQRTDYPQAWWCWPAEREVIEPDPVDMEEEGRQVAEAMG